MSWTRLDDNWTRSRVIRRLNLAARWHYLCMIQQCSGGGDYDGMLPLIDALRCSDVPDAEEALGTLIEAGLVENIDGETVRLVHIKDHVPSAEQLNAREEAKVRARRYRKHKAGEHGECHPDRCTVAAGFGVSESRDATEAYEGGYARDGTGRAGTGRAPSPANSELAANKAFVDAYFTQEQQ